MCQRLQAFTTKAMSSCFGTWARLVIRHNRIMMLLFLGIYLFLGQNIRNVQEFPYHASESYVWAPVNNPTVFNEAKANRMFDHKRNKGMFWVELDAEEDARVRAQMLDTWVYDPEKTHKKNQRALEQQSLQKMQNKFKEQQIFAGHEQAQGNIDENVEPDKDQELESSNHTKKTTGHDFWLMFQAKRPTWNATRTLFTIEHFQEMINFEEWMMNLQYPVPLAMETADLSAGEPRTMLKFSDVCRRTRRTSEELELEWYSRCNDDEDLTFCGIIPGVTMCERTHSPIDFIYERKSDTYALSKYRTNRDLIDKVRTGKGDQTFMYNSTGNNIWVEILFGSTTPKQLKQDYIFGDNDIISSEAFRYSTSIRSLPYSEGFSDDWRFEYELWLYNQIVQWGKRSQYFEVQCFSDKIWELSFISDVIGDAVKMITAIALIFLYSFVVLGNCSPVHMRSVAAVVGVSCVGLSICAGYGIAAHYGYLISKMHTLMPFLMLGLGVDDMFVIVNSIDQTPLHLKATDRFKIGLTHAGPSITITSVTDGLAFFLGSMSTVPALNSFCIYCGICVVCLYFSFLTIFSPFFLDDLRRVQDRRGDCFGICCCKEDTIFCFRGILLPQRLKKFSEIEDKNSEPQADPKTENFKNDCETEKYASFVEEVIATVIAPEVLSQQGRIFVLALWLLLIVCSLAAIPDLEVNFSMEYFIPKGSQLRDYLQLDIQHFQTGFAFDVDSYVVDVDLTSEGTQLQMIDYYDKVKRNYLCEEQWFVDTIIWRAWYDKFNSWVRAGDCVFRPEGLKPFEKVVPSEVFYLCWHMWMEQGGDMKEVQMSFEENPLQRTIWGFRDEYRTKRIENASTQGVSFLKDMRWLLAEFGPGHTFDYSWRFYDFEQYVVLMDEFSLTMVLSVVAVLSVILIVSSNYLITILVAMCICVTDIFLVGLVYYWGLTFNPVVILQLVLAIGTSVDFSAHIAYAYLVETVPSKHSKSFNNPSRIRIYKAKQAIAKMGSSVFHGGFSTMVALSVLAPANTYIFVVFYRLWTGILLFGMANGFFFLPVMLSYIGPVGTQIDKNVFDTEVSKVTDYDIKENSEVLSENNHSQEVSDRQNSNDTARQELQAPETEVYPMADSRRALCLNKLEVDSEEDLKGSTRFQEKHIQKMTS